MTRKLRVLHINLSGGGLGRYGALFAWAMSVRDDVEILSVINPDLLSSSKPLERILRGVPTVVCPVHSSMNKAALIPALRKVIKSWRPDIIHDTSGSGYALGVIALWLIRGDIPWIVTEHDPEPHLGMGTSLHSRWARFLVRHYADHIFVHGPLGKQVLIKQGAQAPGITIIRHGRLDLLYDYYGNAGPIQREPFTVLFFGALRPNKGVQLLIPIAERLYVKHPLLKFVVAGSSKVARELQRSSWPRELEEILAEMRKRPYFEVHNRFIPDEEVSTFFQRASITLLPYLDATQSGVAMIAMPFGSVVVATRVGDLPYTVQDGKTGLLVKPCVDDIVEKLDWALANPEKLGDIRESAKAWVESECNWEIIVEKIVAVYSSLEVGI